MEAEKKESKGVWFYLAGKRYLYTFEGKDDYFLFPFFVAGFVYCCIYYIMLVCWYNLICPLSDVGARCLNKILSVWE